MPPLPPNSRKTSPAGGSGGWLGLGLWIAVGLAPGLALGVVAGRAFFPGDGVDGGGKNGRSGHSPGRGFGSGDADPGATDGGRGSSLGAKPIQGSLFENLRAVARGMSQEQRMDELKRMMEEDGKSSRLSFFRRNLQSGGVDRQLQYLALVQKEDLPLIKEMLEGMTPNQMNNNYSMRNSCATAWAMLDPQGLEDWVKDHIGKNRNGSYSYEAQTLASYWNSLDSSVAWEKVTEMDHAVSKADENNGYWIQRMMGKFVKENAQLAYQRAQTLENRSMRRTALTSVLTDMAKTDLAKAMEMAGQQDSVIEANKLEANVLSSYANSTSNYKEAGDYILQHGSEYARQNTLGSMFYNWARKDSEGMKAWIADNKSEVDSLQLEQRWGNYFDRNEDPDTTIARALESEDKNVRRNKLSNAYSTLMDQRPEEALSRLKSLDDETLEQVAPSVLSTLSQYDPERAVGLVSTLPEKVQTNAMSNVFSRWMYQNPEEASTWLDKQPASPVKDQAIEQLVNSQSSQDPESAVLWAMQVSSEEKQRSVLNNAIYQWGQTNPEAARSWLKGQNFAEKTRAELVERLESSIKSKQQTNNVD